MKQHIDNIAHLNNLNTIKINDIYCAKFNKYAKIINYSFVDLIETAKIATEIPKQGNIYVASSNELESNKSKIYLQDNVFGSSNIQIGYCNGNSCKLNAFEYHKCSEVFIAVTNCVLLFADLRDIKDNTLHTSKAQAFYIPEGNAIEVYSTTLHFAPCKIESSGYKTIIVLTKNTNEDFQSTFIKHSNEDELLFKQNKWLIAHEECKLVEKGAFVGLVGDNIEIKY